MLVWLGDFNYRIDGAYEAVKERAIRNELGQLLELVGGALGAGAVGRLARVLWGCKLWAVCNELGQLLEQVAGLDGVYGWGMCRL